MLERVFRGGVPDLAQEIRSLERPEIVGQFVGGNSEHSRKQSYGYVRSDDGGSLEECLRRPIQQIDARSENGVNCLRDINPSGGLANTILARLTLKPFCLCEPLNQLLQEQGIALRLRPDTLFQRQESYVGAHEPIEQFVRRRVLERQEIEADKAAVRPIPLRPLRND